jgi:hypothetical protein
MDNEQVNNAEVENTEAVAVVDTQVDAGIQTKSQDVNWNNARNTMAAQAGEIKALTMRIESLGQAQSQSSKKGVFDDRTGDDIITVDDFNKAMSEKEQAYNSQIAELKIQTRYRDYSDVVNKYGKNLPAAMKQAIMTAQDPYETAYEACKNSAAYARDNQAEHANVKKINENLSKPGNASAAGSSASLSGASKYASMSSNDILAMSRKFAAGA